MRIMVVDGQGGGMGKQLVAAIRTRFPDADIMAIGTNSTATNVMLKAGASEAATGENSVIVGCRTADVIIGPLGIVIADALLGEITPRMACAVGQSHAQRILLPLDRCANHVAGVPDMTMAELIEKAVVLLEKIMGNNDAA